jgi:hypothetical protein
LPSSGLQPFKAGIISWTFDVTQIMKSFLWSLALYLCSGMYKSYQFLAIVKATSCGKLLDSMPGTVVW